MRGLLAGKEALKAFYARYSAFVNAFLRFITAFAAVFLINQNIGLMPKLSGGLVPLRELYVHFSHLEPLRF